MKPNGTDILLIHPGNRKQIYQALGDLLSAVEPPVWAGLMATYLRKKGFGVELIDADAEELTPEETAQRVTALQPLLTAVIVYGQQPSASTQTMPAAGAVCRAIKQADPSRKVILVGGHVASLSERALREEAVDFVAGGEGPVTLWELTQALKANGSGDLSNVRGLWYREGDRIRANEPAPLVKELEQEMPGMAWDLLPMKKYRAHNWHCFGDLRRQPYASLYTTLGCPFHCSFCCIQAPFKSGEKLLGYKQATNSYRFWSPKRVADELESLVKEYGVRNVKFADEIFVLNLSHVGGICDAIIERGLKLNIWAYARVDTVKDALLDKLKRAGVNWLAFGIESANERVRDDVQKGFGQAEIFKTITKVRETGIHVIGNYIFGLPEDDLKTMQETLDLALELNCEFANFYCFVPGTPVYTPRGVVAIEKVFVGQEVSAQDGVTKVVDCLKRYYEGKVLDIKPRYLPSVTVTPEHPLLLARLQRDRENRAQIQSVSWRQAKDIVCFDQRKPLLAYDAVVLPKAVYPAEETCVEFTPFVEGRVGAGHRGGQLNGTGRRYLEPWKVSEDLAELFGWYVAEGYRLSKANDQIGFALSSEEEKNIARVRELVYECFGFQTQVLPRKGSKCVVVSMVSKVLYRALPALFGKNAHGKRIPPFILNAKANVAGAFLKGYVAGDGTSHPNELGQYSVTSCSDELVREVMGLFMKTGILPSYGKSANPNREIRGRPVPATTHYSLSWVEGPQYKHYLEDGANFYVPIKSVAEKEYCGMVYNLSTANETYAVPFVVHNCAMAYPGSPLYEQAEREGWPLPETWSGYSQHSVDSLPLPTKYLSAGEVLAFRDDAFHTYFESPRYREMVRAKFGAETEAHIRQMTSVRLVRKRVPGGRQQEVAG